MSLLAGCTPARTPTVEAAPPTTVPADNRCSCNAPATDVPETEAPKTSTELILATTTSTRDLGLLDVLLPLFEAQSGYKVKMVAVVPGPP